MAGCSGGEKGEMVERVRSERRKLESMQRRIDRSRFDGSRRRWDLSSDRVR